MTRMGPIVLLAGVVVLLYAVAALFAGGSVASARRGGQHSRGYAVASIVAGLVIALVGLTMILA